MIWRSWCLNWLRRMRNYGPLRVKSSELIISHIRIGDIYERNTTRDTSLFIFLIYLIWTITLTCMVVCHMLGGCIERRCRNSISHVKDLHWTLEKAINTPAIIKKRDRDRQRKVKLYIILYKIKKFFRNLFN